MSLFPESRIILDLCGGTGSWSRPYAEAGYDVRIIDPKISGEDVRLLRPIANVRGILAAPPCTMFALSGNGARAREKARGEYEGKLTEALSVADACLRIVYACRPAWWALENPNGTLANYIGPPAVRFDPCEFGDAWTKRTCLWGYFKFPDRERVHATEFWGWRKLGGKSERTKTLRSMTPQGFAKAFFEANP